MLGPIVADKYASNVTKILGLECNADHFLIMYPSSVFAPKGDR